MTKQLLQKNKGVFLRDIEQRDASLLMALNNDLEIAEYVVGTPKNVTFEEQLKWMDKIKSELNTKRFIIEYNGEGVGTVIVSNIDIFNLTADMNIKLIRAVHGKGIGKESLKIALQYCFDHLKLSCVTAHILPYNTASIALFEGCGFSKEGILRNRVVKQGRCLDLLSYSILSSEFQQ